MDCFAAKEADEKPEPKTPKAVKINPFVLPAASKLNVSFLSASDPINYKL